MDDEAQIVDLNSRRVATVAPSMLLSTGSTAPSTTKVEFSRHVSPCLALTAPTGMDKAERQTWLSAAHRALAKYPEHIIAPAADEAMRKADHPSKIVPLIAEHAEQLWLSEQRRQAQVMRPAVPLRSVETDDERWMRERIEARVKAAGANLRVDGGA